jgi:hypothetical protein
MESYFNILLSSTVGNKRPPISFKVREYLEGFIIENVLKKFKIVQGGKWKIALAIFFIERGEKYDSANIFLAKGARTVEAESIKIYEILIPIEEIKASPQPYLKTIELLYEAIKIFLTNTYKKVTPALMDELWGNLDLEYLLSIPYPVSYEEQQYVGDKGMPPKALQK